MLRDSCLSLGQLGSVVILGGLLVGCHLKQASPVLCLKGFVPVADKGLDSQGYCIQLYFFFFFLQEALAEVARLKSSPMRSLSSISWDRVYIQQRKEHFNPSHLPHRANATLRRLPF